MTLVIRSDRSMLGEAADMRLLAVEHTAPRRNEATTRTPVSLCLVIDRSGSMGHDKMALALRAAREAIHTLNDGDHLSVVCFDEVVDVVFPSTAATPAAKSLAESRLLSITARGSTDLGGGWLTGCAEVGRGLTPDALGRCFVLTDGQANHGIVDVVELARHARELRNRRVTTSTLGLGEGFNEFLLGRIAEEGGGTFYFAERAEQLAAIVAQEIGEVLTVVARDVNVVVHAPVGVVVESLNDHPVTNHGTAWSFAVGSLSAGRSLSALFRLRLPRGSSDVSVDVHMTDSDGVLGDRRVPLTWARRSAALVAGEGVDVGVARPAAVLDAARARRKALELNQGGALDDAGRVIDDAVAALRGSAGGDGEILVCAQQLADERERFAQPLSRMGSKMAFSQAMMQQKLRSMASSSSSSSSMASSSSSSSVSSPRMSGVRALATSRRLTTLQTAADTFAGLSGLGALHVDAAPEVSLPDVLHPGDEERLLRRLPPTNDLTVVFVDEHLHDAWFSHWHPRHRAVVVSCAGVVDLTGLAPEAFVAYELLFHGLRTQSGGYDPLKMVHKEHRGCLFDLCAEKAELAVKLQAGHICGACVTGLKDLGIDATAVARLWSAVQVLAHA